MADKLPNQKAPGATGSRRGIKQSGRDMKTSKEMKPLHLIRSPSSPDKQPACSETMSKSGEEQSSSVVKSSSSSLRARKEKQKKKKAKNGVRRVADGIANTQKGGGQNMDHAARRSDGVRRKAAMAALLGNKVPSKESIREKKAGHSTREAKKVPSMDDKDLTLTQDVEFEDVEDPGPHNARMAGGKQPLENRTEKRAGNNKRKVAAAEVTAEEKTVFESLGPIRPAKSRNIAYKLKWKQQQANLIKEQPTQEKEEDKKKREEEEKRKKDEMEKLEKEEPRKPKVKDKGRKVEDGDKKVGEPDSADKDKEKKAPEPEKEKDKHLPEFDAVDRNVKDEIKKPDNFLAKRFLDISRRNNMMENLLLPSQNAILKKYFENGKRPDETTPQVLDLLERGIDKILDAILFKADELDTPIDNDIRWFIINRDAAKGQVLEVMLLYPEYLPFTWGGKVYTPAMYLSAGAGKTPQKPQELNDAMSRKVKAHREDKRAAAQQPNAVDSGVPKNSFIRDQGSTQVVYGEVLAKKPSRESAERVEFPRAVSGCSSYFNILRDEENCGILRLQSSEVVSVHDKKEKEDKERAEKEKEREKEREKEKAEKQEKEKRDKERHEKEKEKEKMEKAAEKVSKQAIPSDFLDRQAPHHPEQPAVRTPSGLKPPQGKSDYVETSEEEEKRKREEEERKKKLEEEKKKKEEEQRKRDEGKPRTPPNTQNFVMSTYMKLF